MGYISKGFGGVLHEFEYNKKVSVSIDTINYDANADIKVYTNMEPEGIIPNSDEVINNQDRFDLILTFKDKILKNCSNSKKFLMTSTTFTESNTNFKLIDFQMNKKNEISFLVSSKSQTYGHLLRHIVLDLLMKNKFNKEFIYNIILSPPYIPTKEPIFKNAKYSIIIENGKYENYITEKLIDCLITKTIPIYYGAPNVGEFFNEKGILQFDNPDEFIDIIKNIDINHYDNSIEYINENYELAKNHCDFHTRLKNEINEFINKK